MIGCPAPYREAVEAKLADTGDRDIVMVQCDSEDRWVELEARARAEDGDVVIAVLPSLVLDDYVRALAMGVAGVVYVDTPSVVTADVVRSAVQGEVVLPRQAAESMALLAKRLQPITALDAGEVELLQQVASGKSIVGLARETYFSERTVRRHLQSLYLKLGVRNRAEAIATATRMGLLD